MRITVLAGGVGAARFLRGLKAEAPDADITVIGNTGDDITLFGLHVSPDLDTVMYTLGGGISEEQGWGRDCDTFTVLAELKAYGTGSGWSGPDWFNLGDKDFATHIVRTSMLAAGQSLSAATAALCQRWPPGVTLIPMTDDRTETHVILAAEPGQAAQPAQAAEPGQAGARRTLTVRYCGVRPSRSVGTNKGDETARSRAGNHTVQKALVMPGSMLGASSKTITHCAQNEY